MDNSIDLDNYFFNPINNDCRYYTDERYNINKDRQLSVIRVNCRSLYANFTNIKGYLRQFKQPFNIIAISETWINTERGLDFELEGYEFTHMDQQNKGGGGVAVYVDKNINLRILDNMTTTVNNLLECVTGEPFHDQKKSIPIRCMYGTLGSNTEIFTNWMKKWMYAKKKKKKIQLDVCNIVRVNEIRFLGVTIDDQITWKPHIKHKLTN